MRLTPCLLAKGYRNSSHRRGGRARARCGIEWKSRVGTKPSGPAGLLPAFDTICTREYVRETKPHPALYQLAIERLGVKPQEAFAIEDSPNGVTAAGLRCIAVPNPFTAGMDLRHADCVLPTLAGVPLAEATAQLGT